jgi:uncharacterized protein (DUF305 family)
MKKMRFLSIVFSSVVLLQSCGEGNRDNDNDTDSVGAASSTSEVMDTTPSGISPGDTMANNMSNEPLDKTSQDFVMKAASGGMMEVQLGTMAQEKEFDKAYMTMMVSDHKKDVSDFRNASKSLKDSTIKGFAARTLPVLQMHLDSAQAISKATQ